VPIRASGAGEDPEIHEWDDGVTWIAHPEEAMQRASHALDTAAGTWLVDPIEAACVEELLDDRPGSVTGVFLGLDRHVRDAVAFAERYDVSVTVPEWFGGMAALDGQVERTAERLPDTRYRLRRVVDGRVWNEAALWAPDDGTLVVPESVGTTAYFRAPGERLGVHPARRLTPPRESRAVDPQRVAVGHGTPLVRDATAALRDALSGARWRAPLAYGQAIGALLRR
jgi:hypothetical protein